MASRPAQNDFESEHGEAAAGDSGGEEDKLQKLEAEVNQMAEKLVNYRTTLPDQLRSALSTVLESRRPIFPTHFISGSESQPGTSTDPNPDVVRRIEPGNKAQENEQESDKINVLKQKISSNAATLPVILKRMRDCMKRIDDLDSCNGINIPPVFKRKRNS